MYTLEQCLGIGDRLEAAAELLPGWGLTHPELGVLESVGDVVRATRTGSAKARDDVLFGLAVIAGSDREGCLEATAIMCRLLIPGVISKLGHLRLPASSDEVTRLAAAQLWLECRTFDCDARPKVAPTIVWNVRRRVLNEYGIGGRGDRTWAHTALVDDVALDYLTGPEPDAEPDFELTDVLTRALDEQLIDDQQARLLLAVLHASERAGNKRMTTHGLLSADVSGRVGAELGMGASTVRAHVGRALLALRERDPLAA